MEFLEQNGVEENLWKALGRQSQATRKLTFTFLGCVGRSLGWWGLLLVARSSVSSCRVWFCMCQGMSLLHYAQSHCFQLIYSDGPSSKKPTTKNEQLLFVKPTHCYIIHMTAHVWNAVHINHSFNTCRQQLCGGGVMSSFIIGKVLIEVETLWAGSIALTFYCACYTLSYQGAGI